MEFGIFKIWNGYSNGLFSRSVGEGTDIVEKLKSSQTYSGMTGETSFDPFGEPVKAIDLVQLTVKAN